MQTQQAVLGVAILGVSLHGYGSYIREILPWLRRGATPVQPERRAWTIWAVQYSVLTVAQVLKGEMASLWLAAPQLVGVLAVFGLSLPFGVGAFDRVGWLSLAGVLSGIGLAVWCHDSGMAIIVSLSIEVYAMVFCWVKAARDPYSETYGMWVAAGVAGLLGIPAVGFGQDIILYLFPVCLAAINLAMVATIWQCRRLIRLEVQ